MCSLNKRLFLNRELPLTACAFKILLSCRVVEPNYLHAIKVVLPARVTLLLRQDNSPLRVVSPSRVVSPTSCKRLIEFFKEKSGKISRPG